LKFDVVTIFPDWFDSPLRTGLLGKALLSGLLQVRIHDLRQWGSGPHRKVDDAPFGGGAGMVMAAGPVVEAVEAVRAPGGRVVLLAAGGRPLTQAAVQDFSHEAQLVLVCGRYEGMDDRIREVLGAEEWSIGEFVLGGGEVAAWAVIEAVSRLVPGLMGNEASIGEESFSSGLLEYPQYTRPAEFRGFRVPEVLLSGNHGAVAAWRREQALRRTLRHRPHLLDQARLSEEERALLQKPPAEGVQGRD
jgi:tRNA (guanine37-N1)-methyltransferase